MMVAPKPMIDSAELRSQFDYDPETGELQWKHQASRGKDWNAQYAGKKAGSLKVNGYVQVGLSGRVLYGHRIVWAIVHGSCDRDILIDHIDGDRSNNRISNLRLASVSENSANAKIARDNRSGVKGVSWVVKAQKWHASVVFKKKHHFVGRFDRLEEAAAATRIMREKIHGEFARFA